MPIVEVVTIKSTSLARVAYDHQCATLTIKFRDGTAYQYEGVPLETFVDLLRANSKGAYLIPSFERYAFALLDGATPVSQRYRTFQRF